MVHNTELKSVARPTGNETITEDITLFASGTTLTKHSKAGATEYEQLAKNWSDPTTWGAAGKPVAGQDVTIPADVTILLDESTPDLGGLTIQGILQFARQDLSLTADYILIDGGELAIGTESEPFTHKAVITLNDTDTEHEGPHQMGTRGLLVMNDGVLNLHGATPNVVWTKINDHVEAGGTAMTLREVANWKTGDEIIVGPTDIYEAANGASITQRVTITSISDKNVEFSQPLGAFRWGKLQYATKTGMALTPDNLIESPSYTPSFSIDLPEPPKILDQRAPVGNLTRNIVIQAPDDALWQEEGFGVHVMLMHQGAKAFVDGIEIKRGGKRGRLGRYPFHWHMLSYSGTETLNDATGQYFKNSSINESANRGVVIHGTNGTLVQNNVLYHIEGHAIFTEDAVERRNVIDGNLVLHVRSPEPEHALKKHELGAFGRGVAGLWLSNPDNTVTNNHLADCEGNGIWMAFPAKPFGTSADVLYEDGEIINPRRMRFGVFDYNTVHSINKDGIHNDNPEIDEAGNTGSSGFKDYASTVTGREVPWPYTDRRRFTIRGNAVWKCGGNGLWERVNWVDNIGSIAADNQKFGFAGSGAEGYILGALVVGESLNVGRNQDTWPFVHSGFASYHHTFQFDGNLMYNFPAVAGESSGVFTTRDYYIRPVEMGHVQTEANVFVNSHPGVKLTAQESWQQYYRNDKPSYFNLSGALYDPSGFWGTPGNYFVFDDPFYTHGLTPELMPGYTAELSGGVSVPGPYYGFDAFQINDGEGVDENATMGIEVKRYDESWTEVGGFTLLSGTKADAYSNGGLKNMRDFAAHYSGYFELTFPENNPPNRVRTTVTNMTTQDDNIIIGVEYSGRSFATVRIAATFRNEYETYASYTAVNSREELVASDGEVYWQDFANDRVWVKLRGGYTNFEYDEFDWEKSVYQQFDLLVEQGEGDIPELITSIHDQQDEIKLYPNPTNGRLNVVGTGSLNVKVTDVYGRTVHKSTVMRRGELELGLMPAGIYLVEVNEQRHKIILR